MTANSLTMEVFIHMDAVGRNDWIWEPDERPLTALGKQQASRMADELIEDSVNRPSIAARRPVVVRAFYRWHRSQVFPSGSSRDSGDTKGYRAPTGWENPDWPADPLGGGVCRQRHCCASADPGGSGRRKPRSPALIWRHRAGIPGVPFWTIRCGHAGEEQ